jgi:hypothetical protein
MHHLPEEQIAVGESIHLGTRSRRATPAAAARSGRTQSCTASTPRRHAGSYARDTFRKPEIHPRPGANAKFVLNGR